MTRVTERMIFNSVTASVSRTQQRWLEANNRASSGRRVLRASDDPVAASRAVLLRSSMERLDGMTSAADHARLQLMAAESAFAEGGDIINQARELTVRGATGTLTAGERAILAEQVDGLQRALLAIANTDVAGTYVFAGFKTDTEPFSGDGTYVGDSGVHEIEIIPGQKVAAHVPGDRAFGAAGGIDVFGLLQGLRDDLNANDVDAVRNRLGDLDRASDQIDAARADTGIALTQISNSDGLRAETSDILASGYADSVEIDAVLAYTDLIEAQNAFRAALAEANRILSFMGESL